MFLPKLRLNKEHLKTKINKNGVLHSYSRKNRGYCIVIPEHCIVIPEKTGGIA